MHGLVPAPASQVARSGPAGLAAVPEGSQTGPGAGADVVPAVAPDMKSPLLGRPRVQEAERCPIAVIDGVLISASPFWRSLTMPPGSCRLFRPD
jgi:hypothetical protein